MNCEQIHLQVFNWFRSVLFVCSRLFICCSVPVFLQNSDIKISIERGRRGYTVKKNISKFLVILANLTNQMRVNFKVDTHFQGMRALV